MIPKDQGGGGTANQKVNRELSSLTVQNKVVQNKSVHPRG